MQLPDGLEIRPSPIHGLGVFATKNLPDHRRLGEYTGVRYSLADFKAKYGSDTRHCYIARRANYILCSKESRNFITYINESNEPNVYLNRRRLYASRPIAAGEELLLQYPKTYFRCSAGNADGSTSTGFK